MKIHPFILECMSHRCTRTTLELYPRSEAADKCSWWYMKDATQPFVEALISDLVDGDRDSLVNLMVSSSFEINYRNSDGTRSTEDDTRYQINIYRLYELTEKFK